MIMQIDIEKAVARIVDPKAKENMARYLAVEYIHQLVEELNARGHKSEAGMTTNEQILVGLEFYGYILAAPNKAEIWDHIRAERKRMNLGQNGWHKDMIPAIIALLKKGQVFL